MISAKIKNHKAHEEKLTSNLEERMFMREQIHYKTNKNDFLEFVQRK